MNNLKTLSSEELDAQLSRHVKSERKITHLILNHIAEIESRRLYLDFGSSAPLNILPGGTAIAKAARTAASMLPGFWSVTQRSRRKSKRAA